MPGSFIDPIFANGGTETQYLAAQHDDTVLSRASWNWQRRNMAATWDRIGWVQLWPRSHMQSGDVATPMSHLGGCGESGGQWFEPPSVMGSGTQTTKFLKGTIYDANGVAAANATVDGFLTATDVWVGSVTSNLDGTYALGTNNLPSAQHYLVAYKAGSPDVAGTTVNTLLPTNIDGT